MGTRRFVAMVVFATVLMRQEHLPPRLRLPADGIRAMQAVRG